MMLVHRIYLYMIANEMIIGLELFFCHYILTSFNYYFRRILAFSSRTTTLEKLFMQDDIVLRLYMTPILRIIMTYNKIK